MLNTTLTEKKIVEIFLWSYFIVQIYSKVGDGTITKAEFEASPFAKMFQSFDNLRPNESGEVTKSAFIGSIIKIHPEKNET